MTNYANRTAPFRFEYEQWDGSNDVDLQNRGIMVFQDGSDWKVELPLGPVTLTVGDYFVLAPRFQTTQDYWVHYSEADFESKFEVIP